jgi:hypothetical protein
MSLAGAAVSLLRGPTFYYTEPETGPAGQPRPLAARRPVT